MLYLAAQTRTPQDWDETVLSFSFLSSTGDSAIWPLNSAFSEDFIFMAGDLVSSLHSALSVLFHKQ